MGKIAREHVSGRMSKIVIHNDTAYLCGQIGVPDTSLQNQAKEMLSRVEKLSE